MSTATIKLFLPYGDPKRLRTAEISNWSGKAIAAPRTEFDELLAREEMDQSGIYILTGTDPDSGKPTAYVGEAEVLRDRLKLHKSIDFWVHVVTFVSKDENLTKSHIRYLEGRFIAEARSAARFDLSNSKASGSRLPEADRHDMEEFLTKAYQLLPVLGSELLTPVLTSDGSGPRTPVLHTEIKGLTARGKRTPTGFVVLQGSEAVAIHRSGAGDYAPSILLLREELLQQGALRNDNSRLVFTRDVEFSSPSAAAGVIQGGSANGLTAWRTEQGRTLKEIEEDEDEEVV